MQSLFITNDDGYTRDSNPLRNYVEVAGYYLSKMNDEELGDTTKWTSQQLAAKNPEVYPNSPQIKYLTKDGDEDRRVEYGTLEDYIGHVISSNRIMVGTGTVYKRVDEQKSLFTDYINDSRNQRSVFKGKMKEAKRLGLDDQANFYNELQNNAKIDINTLSGATLTPSTSIHTASIHPTLTSTGRIGTSLANAINEKLIRGNRHFETPAVTLDSIVVQAYKTDIDKVDKAVNEFNLHIPTVDQIMYMVQESSRNYWRNTNKTREIKEFVQTLSDTERCNVMYNGSLWDIIHHNPEFAYTMLDELSEPSTDVLPVEEADKVISATYDDLRILSIYLCYDITKGKSLDSCREDDHTTYGIVAATIVKIDNVLQKYGSVLEAFFKLNILPGNIFNIKAMYRKAVVTSDTDSTNFTVQEICKFMTGKYAITDKDRKITFLITYFSSMMVCQALGILSANMGVTTKYIRELSMKNEFYIPIHCLTPSAKNYIMIQAAQEGIMLPKIDLVTKGVELRSSKIPKVILDIFEDYKESIFVRLEQGVQLTVKDVVQVPVNLETKLLRSLKAGNPEYLFNIFVKDPSAYALGENAAPWKYHRFYEEVFGDVYGHVSDIPYSAYTVKVNLTSKTKLKKWVDTIKHPVIKKNAELFIKKNQLTTMGALIFPVALFSNRNLPDEVINIIEVEPLVMMAMSPWYLVFESFGIYLKNKHNSRMMSYVFKEYVDEDAV